MKTFQHLKLLAVARSELEAAWILSHPGHFLGHFPQHHLPVRAVFCRNGCTLPGSVGVAVAKPFASK